MYVVIFTVLAWQYNFLELGRHLAHQLFYLYCCAMETDFSNLGKMTAVHQLVDLASAY